MRPFSIGDQVVSVRDVEMSNRATVIGYEENERGFVLVQFADGIRTLPTQSVEKPADRKDKSQSRPIGQGKIWAEASNLGDYLRRVGEAETGISTKEQHHEKSAR